MISNFQFPSVDHLIEGVHYKIVEWNFAAGQGCPEGEKMVFGVCRKVGGSKEKDFDSSKETEQEQKLRAASGKQVTTKEEAVAANKQGFTTEGKKFGWAIKNGKPVIVEWGSVAGTKPKGDAKPAVSAPPSATPTQSGNLPKTPAPKG